MGSPRKRTEAWVGLLTTALQVHDGIQVVRDGVPGIRDELGKAGVHFLLDLIVPVRKETETWWTSRPPPRDLEGRTHVTAAGGPGKPYLTLPRGNERECQCLEPGQGLQPNAAAR